MQLYSCSGTELHSFKRLWCCHRWNVTLTLGFDCACLSACSACSNCVPQQQAWPKQIGHSKPGVSKLCVLEGPLSCIFSYNQVQTTRLEYSSLPGETLIGWFSVFSFIGVEAKLCRTRALQDRVWMPRSIILPLSLTPTLHASGFPNPVQK